MMNYLLSLERKAFGQLQIRGCQGRLGNIFHCLTRKGSLPWSQGLAAKQHQISLKLVATHSPFPLRISGGVT